MEKRGRTDGGRAGANSRAKWVVCSPDSAPYGPTKTRTAKHTYTRHAYMHTHGDSHRMQTRTQDTNSAAR